MAVTDTGASINRLLADNQRERERTDRAEVALRVLIPLAAEVTGLLKDYVRAAGGDEDDEWSVMAAEKAIRDATAVIETPHPRGGLIP